MGDNAIRTITPYLCANGAERAIAFYREAFGAKEGSRIVNDDGRIGHAELRIGDETIYLSDEWPEGKVLSPATLGARSVSLVMEVADADAAVQRAVAAGATLERPLVDEQFGRSGWIVDPFGHHWNILGPGRGK